MLPGDRLPMGYVNTLKVIQHRNKILEDPNFGFEVPKASENMSEYGHLEQCLKRIVAENGGNGNYKQFYYPPASLLLCLSADSQV